jgi:hypothetical protein
LRKRKGSSEKVFGKKEPGDGYPRGQVQAKKYLFDPARIPFAAGLL